MKSREVVIRLVGRANVACHLATVQKRGSDAIGAEAIVLAGRIGRIDRRLSKTCRQHSGAAVDWQEAEATDGQQGGCRGVGASREEKANRVARVLAGGKYGDRVFTEVEDLV